MYKTKFINYYLLLILLGVCFSLGCGTSPKIPDNQEPTQELKLAKGGVDFMPVLDCVGKTEPKIIEPKYDRRRRTIEYTKTVTCLSSGRLYSLKYFDIQYKGQKPFSYQVEMNCDDPKEHHTVFYKDIEYNAENDVVGYVAILDGSEKKYRK